ncbi:MAG: SpoIIE family protein phosphatase [Coriobacteriia bacterium]|nr:SpoIIE family protein phosphatase [Coriobacteriia bacterium]
MRHRDAPRLTLTNRLLALAAAIVIITTLLLVSTTAAGVYEMAQRQATSRQLAYREMLVADIGGQLGAAGRVVRTCAADPALLDADDETVARALAALGAEHTAWVWGMILTESNGVAVASWSAGTAALDGAPEASPAAAAQGLTFRWTAAPGSDGAGALWAVAPVRLPGGPPRVLVVRLRTGFVSTALDHVARTEGSTHAIVFEESGQRIFGEDVTAGGDDVYSFRPDDAESGTGSLRVDGTRPYVGHYSVLPDPPGPAWRVGVVEPAEGAWSEILAALQPGLIGWLAALGVALIAALIVVGRVTRPLRQLEVRARALAAGAQVEPATVESRDEVGRLLEAFNSVVRRMDRLGDIAELLARASDMSLVLQGVTSSITHMLGEVDVDVLLLSEEGRLDLVAAEGALAGSRDVSIAVDDVTWVADALESGESVVAAPGVDDVLLGLHGHPSAAVLAAPLRSGVETIGAVVVVRSGPVPFTETESETVRSFAAQASIALQNSRLFEEERQSRREAEALQAIAERLASPLALEETLAELGRMAAELLGLDRALVFLDDRARFGLAARTDDEPPEWAAAYRSFVAADKPGEGPVLLGRGEAGDGPVTELLERRDARAVLFVPLRMDEVQIGLLVLLSGRDHARLGPHRLALADTIGKQVSLALQNASLYEQATSRADNLETIFRISHAVASSLQSRIVLNRVLDVVQKILSADAVMLLTYDAQRKVMTVPMARGALHQDMLEATFRAGEDVVGRVFETREPERFDRLTDTDTRLLNAASEQGLQSLLAVPLLARGRSIGVLVAFAMAESAFSSDELDLLRTFASQAALAIDTADMFSREHHVATVLQQSILPTRLPRIDGIEASSVYLPAVGDAEIGGDYYDMFMAPDGRVVVSIGDVCGKGVEAATQTSMIKYAIRGMAVAGLGPARIVKELNAMLIETGDPAGIVTLWIGFLDTATGELAYANGGHPPTLVLDPTTGRISRLTTTGALLGAVTDTEWGESSFTMDPGATLLLYTDGVTEARSGARFFGEGRVRRALGAGGSAADVSQRLLELLQRFASGELRDDAAILAVVRTS